MIRSKAKFHKTIPLFFLLASAASLAAASELPQKARVRVEEKQNSHSIAAPAAAGGASPALQARHERPDRNADRDRGRGDRGRGGDRDRGRGDRGRGDRGRGDRGRGNGSHHDGDRNNGNHSRPDVDRHQDRSGGDHRDRNRGGWDNNRRDDRSQGDRGRRDGNWGHDGRNDRHDGNWSHDGRYDRHDNHRGRWENHYGRNGHGSWGTRRAWYNSHWRNGYYYRLGRFLDFAFDVPRFLALDWGSRYDEYYYGTVYHDGFGDNVEVFLFPVYYADHVEYVPYAYYEGQLVGRGRMLSGGPSVSFRFDF